MRGPQMCNVVCRTILAFKDKIDDEYRVNIILDNLPLVVPIRKIDQENAVVYPLGFHVSLRGKYAGSKKEKTFYPQSLVIYSKISQGSTGKFYKDCWLSVKHEYEGHWNKKTLITCDPHAKHADPSSEPPQELDGKEIIFTYDVDFQTLYRDISEYNQLETQEEVQEESGWKLVHGDVFRPPTNFDNRNLVFSVFIGVFAKYTLARLYKKFKGTEWKKFTLKTAVMFLATAFAIFFILNALIWGQKSSGAVPFGAMFALFYYMFGFLFIVFVIRIVTCAEITVVLSSLLLPAMQ
ncbi:hypothetical protein V6N12_007082 [Hibiscus sabdariffa]|uniref:Transmembrane 9 superfamily member n=1 Tax=Hibiscus sabdariffa TaxID=183260 RepID=A0ABR2F0S0_9ROSI